MCQLYKTGETELSGGGGVTTLERHLRPIYIRRYSCGIFIARRGTLPPAVAFTSGFKLAGNGERYANEFTPTTCLGARDTTDEGSPWIIPHTRA